MKQERIVDWIKTNGQLPERIIRSWEASDLLIVYRFLRLALLADVSFDN